MIDSNNDKENKDISPKGYESKDIFFSRYAVIECANAHAGEELTDLKIGGKNIGFLIPEVSEASKLYKIQTPTNEGSEEEWFLSFFAGTEFEKNIKVCIQRSSPGKNPNGSFNSGLSGKKAFCIAHLDLDPSKFSPDNKKDRKLISSRFTRGSKALPENKIIRFKNQGEITIDLRRVVYTNDNDDNFKRVIIIAALADAYSAALDDFTKTSSSLASKQMTKENFSETSRDLTDLLQKLSLFKTAYYYKHPIQLDRIDLPPIWEKIQNELKLKEKVSELSEQIASLSQVSDLISQRKGEEASSRFNRRIAYWGTALTAASLIDPLISLLK